MGYYERNYESNATFEDLKGKTIRTMTGLEKGSDKVDIETTDGKKYQMVYHDDCCASCSIDEIHGEPADLIGSEILMAEESQSTEHTPERLAEIEKEKAEAKAKDEYYYGPDDSFTWTFYKLATIKGSVTIKWYGSSNGYYSESASFEEVAS